MNNPTFVDEETLEWFIKMKIMMITIHRIQARQIRSFTEPANTEATSTLWLNQKVKQDKLAALYRHLNITGNLDLIDLNQFKLTTGPKKEPQFLSFTMVIDGFL